MKAKVLVTFKVEDGKTHKATPRLQTLEHRYIGGKVSTTSGDVYRVVGEEGVLGDTSYQYRAVA
jgi:hypothetical protein